MMKSLSLLSLSCLFLSFSFASAMENDNCGNNLAGRRRAINDLARHCHPIMEEVLETIYGEDGEVLEEYLILVHLFHKGNPTVEEMNTREFRTLQGREFLAMNNTIDGRESILNRDELEKVSGIELRIY